MKVIEAAGTPTQIGHTTGEALREEIRARLELVKNPANDAASRQLLPLFAEGLRRELPHQWEEIEAMAAGANLPVEDIAYLNFIPTYNCDLDPTSGYDCDDACTNIAFAHGSDGPILGKNNDGSFADINKQQPVCCRVIRPDQGIPTVTFPFCGSLGFADGMNAEGLAMGHSSVGSVFQQSYHHLEVRLWAHEGLMTCRSAAEFTRHMTSRPTRGKGYAWVVIDRGGEALSLEVPCPLVQVRRSHHPQGHIHCVNVYQLEALANADRRKPAKKIHAHKRVRMLDEKLDGVRDGSLEEMKSLLRFHGDEQQDIASVCRHGDFNFSYTEWSYIALPAEGRVLFQQGQPCGAEYSLATL